MIDAWVLYERRAPTSYKTQKRNESSATDGGWEPKKKKKAHSHGSS